MIIRVAEYSQRLIPSLDVVPWVWTSADSQPTLMPIWLRPPTMVVTIFTQVRVQSGDIVSMEAVNPTRCPGLGRVINTDTFPIPTVRSPSVRLCRTCSPREHPIRWTRRLCRSNIPRPHLPPDITMGCTPCHRAQLLNRSRVHCPTQTTPSVIPLLLPRLLPRAPANRQSSWRLLSTVMPSHLSQMPNKRRCHTTFRMDLSRPASVRLRLLPTASRASLVASIQNLEASMITRPTSTHTRDANHSTCPFLFPFAQPIVNRSYT